MDDQESNQLSRSQRSEPATIWQYQYLGIGANILVPISWNRLQKTTYLGKGDHIKKPTIKMSWWSHTIADAFKLPSSGVGMGWGTSEYKR